MYVEIAAGAFLLGDFIYHRFFEDEPARKIPPNEVPIPRIDEGAPVPLLLGRTLVRQPILTWAYCTNLNESGGEFVSANTLMLFAIAIGCDDGNGTNRMHSMQVGDKVVASGITQTGTGLELTTVAGFGRLTVLNGNLSQVLANVGNTSSTAPTWAGRRMIEVGIPINEIAAYRGYLSVFFHELASGWLVDLGAQPSYAFECSSYHTSHPQLATYNRVGDDMNPANALYLLLKQKFGALGIDSSMIDLPSFQAAQYTLMTETHGYSRAIADQRSGDEHIREILRQIDGAIDVNPLTGKLELYLVRNDYDPTNIFEINKYNCTKLQGFSSSGWVELTNRMRLVYTDRSKNYQDGSVTSTNQGNAVAQSADEEVTIQMPGVTNEPLAKAILNREIAAMSRPLIKCRALCNRSALRLRRGQPVKLVWTNPDIGGLVFRVANVDRGTLEDGAIGVDLIQDYYYVWRNQIPRGPTGSAGLDGLSVGLG